MGRYQVRPLRPGGPAGAGQGGILPQAVAVGQVGVKLVEAAAVARGKREGVRGQGGEEVQVESQKISSARYRVQVKARESFWLIFSESFHPGWKAYIRQSSGVKGQGSDFEWSAVLSALRDWGKKIEIKEHYPVNGYANAWWVPVEDSQAKTKEQESSPSEFEITIEYSPQRWLEIRMVVSLIILVGGVGYFVFRFRQRRITGQADDSDQKR